MRTSKKLSLWFWFAGIFSLLEGLSGSPERSAALMVVAFAALFASYIVEEVERHGVARKED